MSHLTRWLLSLLHNTHTLILKTDAWGKWTGSVLGYQHWSRQEDSLTDQSRSYAPLGTIWLNQPGSHSDFNKPALIAAGGICVLSPCSMGAPDPSARTHTLVTMINRWLTHYLVHDASFRSMCAWEAGTMMKRQKSQTDGRRSASVGISLN